MRATICRGSRCCRPRGGEVTRGRSFLNEQGEAGQQVGLSKTVMKILVDIHPKFGGGTHQCLKGVPRPDAIWGAWRPRSRLVCVPAVWHQVRLDCCAREFRDGKAPSATLLSWPA